MGGRRVSGGETEGKAGARSTRGGAGAIRELLLSLRKAADGYSGGWEGREEGG